MMQAKEKLHRLASRDETGNLNTFPFPRIELHLYENLEAITKITKSERHGE
jgi:hypothetical protein